jgi:hypothetical protein
MLMKLTPEIPEVRKKQKETRNARQKKKKLTNRILKLYTISIITFDYIFPFYENYSYIGSQIVFEHI